MQRKTVSWGTQILNAWDNKVLSLYCPSSITCAATFQVSGLEAFASQDQILILAIIKASDLKMLPKYVQCHNSLGKEAISYYLITCQLATKWMFFCPQSILVFLGKQWRSPYTLYPAWATAIWKHTSLSERSLLLQIRVTLLFHTCRLNNTT